MALGEGLARLFDLEHQASQGAANVRPVALGINAAGATFLCSVPGGGGDTFIVKACGTRTGTYAAFAPISRYYTKATLDGTSAWADSGDLSSNLGTITIGSGQVAFYVGADDIPALTGGYGYVEVVPGTSGIVTAVVHDLAVQRNPKYLRALNS